jgi:hypothetical protein
VRRHKPDTVLVPADKGIAHGCIMQSVMPARDSKMIDGQEEALRDIEAKQREHRLSRSLPNGRSVDDAIWRASSQSPLVQRNGFLIVREMSIGDLK